MLDVVSGSATYQRLGRLRGLDAALEHDRALLDLDQELSDYLVESEPVRLALVAALREGERSAPAVPEALRFRHRDHWMPFMQHLGAAERESLGIIPASIVQHLRSHNYPTAGECSTTAPYSEVSARVKEILKADDRWQRAKERLHARIVTKYDTDENTKRWAALESQRTSLLDRALDSTATTLAGILVKVRFREWMKNYDPYLDAGGAVDEIAMSIADDLAVMGDH
ncbi:hypothetical protein SAMN05216337_1002350 [Bradyrhizobium brasilense]|uniref:Uncharacterized protein n=1 Tax=Bradyrhizobium brasilense TaxID=1419277 RepID=A0A1G6L6N7_9BRAD|nr:hypothetical protein [Bradyrhizobium brasilense]SDC39012.1 hypothetical protein SAMN05216337_1002350 [Bradyrhizobium brasilense]